MMWGWNWATAGEIVRFFLTCAWIAVMTVMAVRLLRYAISVYEKVRWWK